MSVEVFYRGDVHRVTHRRTDGHKAVLSSIREVLDGLCPSAFDPKKIKDFSGLNRDKLLNGEPVPGVVALTTPDMVDATGDGRLFQFRTEPDNGKRYGFFYEKLPTSWFTASVKELNEVCDYRVVDAKTGHTLAKERLL